MSDKLKRCDPRGLIREAYRIDGIGPEDCRSIFLDWALGLKDDQDSSIAAAVLLSHYSGEPADHPMTKVLQDAVDGTAKARRRGGAAARRS
ncbi:MAG: hypothetical protein AAF666_19105 [Pseudomonadota bacterium]